MKCLGNHWSRTEGQQLNLYTCLVMFVAISMNSNVSVWRGGLAGRNSKKREETGEKTIGCSINVWGDDAWINWNG